MNAFNVKLAPTSDGWAWSVCRSDEVLVRGVSPTGNEAIAAAYQAFDDLAPNTTEGGRPVWLPRQTS